MDPPVSPAPVYADLLPVTLPNRSPQSDITVQHSSSSQDSKRSANTFPAIITKARKGKNPALIYKFKTMNNETEVESEMCFAFLFVRTTMTNQVYACSYCKTKGKFIPIKVIDDVFLENPVTIGHICNPLSWAEECAKRTIYSTLQELRANDRPNAKPKKIYLDVLESIHKDKTQDQRDRDAVGDAIGPFEKHRRAFSKAIYVKKNRTTCMEHIDDELRISVVDEQPFVHYHSSDMIICFSRNVIELMVDSGLVSIVGDGCHSYHPKELGETGQLYTVHGVNKSGDHCPLIWAISGNKRKDTYKRIFGMLKRELEAKKCKCDDLQIVIDYERSAISALSEVFTPNQVSGCSFHFSMAMNRRKDKVGLRKFIEEDDAIRRWYGRILALLFLPKDIIAVSGVLESPVPKRHEGYQVCTAFITYFQATWLSGPFSSLWNKFMIFDNRSTNIAEAYHRKLNNDFNNVCYPPLADLLNQLRREECEYYYMLRRRLQGNGDAQRARTHTIMRESLLQQSMLAFQQILQQGTPTQQQVTEYLDEVSLFR